MRGLMVWVVGIGECGLCLYAEKMVDCDGLARMWIQLAGWVASIEIAVAEMV